MFDGFTILLKKKSLEGRPSIGDENVPLSLPSISISSNEHRWNDTIPYAGNVVEEERDIQRSLTRDDGASSSQWAELPARAQDYVS